MIGLRSVVGVVVTAVEGGCSVSLQPRPWPEPDPEIAAVVRGMYARKGALTPLPVTIRDRFDELFADVEFVEAFGDRGTPGWSPGRLALVTVLQHVENLTDRQAAEAVRDRLSWKYALGLGLTDAGFDYSVLSEFRTRLVEHSLETRVLDLLVARLIDLGLLKSRGRQRTDASYVVAAVRQLNQIELAGESVRACLEALAAAAPGWVTARLDAGWVDRYGMRVDSWRLPTSKAKRAELAVAFGADGLALLAMVYRADAPMWLRDLPAVNILRIVLVQNYVINVDQRGREVVKLREADVDGLPPGRSRLVSPYDTDARWGGKRGTIWHGYKVHVSETCDTAPEPAPGADVIPQRLPNLITNVATTDASVADAAMTEPIHRDLAARGLLPARHYQDSGYASADLLVSSLTDFGVRLISPLLSDNSRQARAGTGYDRNAFTINWDTATVTCPQGHTNNTWREATQRGRAVILIRFSTRTCRACPVRADCCNADTGRRLTLRPQPVQHAIDQNHTNQTSQTWQHDYRRRAGVEATIAQAAKTTNVHHARYRGLPKTRLEHNLMATALNLIRLHTYYTHQPLNPRQTSHLSRLDLTLAA